MNDNISVYGIVSMIEKHMTVDFKEPFWLNGARCGDRGNVANLGHVVFDFRSESGAKECILQISARAFT